MRDIGCSTLPATAYQRHMAGNLQAALSKEGLYKILTQDRGEVGSVVDKEGVGNMLGEL